MVQLTEELKNISTIEIDLENQDLFLIAEDGSQINLELNVQETMLIAGKFTDSHDYSTYDVYGVPEEPWEK